MSKRKRFVLTSLVLSSGFIAIQFLSEQYRFLSIGLLGLLTIILFTWSLWEGLGFNATLLTMILPLFFTIGVGLFWFLLPAGIYTRIPVVVLYGIGIYSLATTKNIFTVASIRTIALARAARGVGFVLNLLTFFLLFDTLISLHWHVYFLSFAVFIISFPLYLQAYWTVYLGKSINRESLITALVASLVTTQIAISVFFWPVTVVVGSLFLTVTVYVLLGLGQAQMEGRLFARTVREYLVLSFFVFVGMFLVTSWSG